MYFPNGGSTLHGVSKPGEIIWSRIFVKDEALHMDIGRGKAIELPADETRRRLEATTPQWPIMHAVTYGVTRDQMMARHQANHIQVAYAHDAKGADDTPSRRLIFGALSPSPPLPPLCTIFRPLSFRPPKRANRRQRPKVQRLTACAWRWGAAAP